MKASGPRTSIQITDPSSSTHVLRFTVHLSPDDTVRYLLGTILGNVPVSVTPSLIAAAESVALKVQPGPNGMG